MSRVMVLFATLAAICFGAASQAAEPLALRCDMRSEPGRFVAPTIFVGVQPEKRTAVVSDIVILHFDKKPATGRVITFNDRRLRVSWEVRNIKDSRQTPVARMDFSLSLNRKTRKVEVFARPVGYPNTFSARGTCTPVNAKQVQELLKSS